MYKRVRQAFPKDQSVVGKIVGFLKRGGAYEIIIIPSLSCV